jgi:hypothetical protein
MSQLEREPGEFIVDRWVRDRVTLVAEQRGRVVAAAHLLRYAEDEDTGENYRNAGEIRWLTCCPDAPYGRTPGPRPDRVASTMLVHRGPGEDRLDDRRLGVGVVLDVAPPPGSQFPLGAHVQVAIVGMGAQAVPEP